MAMWSHLAQGTREALAALTALMAKAVWAAMVVLVTPPVKPTPTVQLAVSVTRLLQCVEWAANVMWTAVKTVDVQPRGFARRPVRVPIDHNAMRMRLVTVISAVLH